MASSVYSVNGQQVIAGTVEAALNSRKGLNRQTSDSLSAVEESIPEPTVTAASFEWGLNGEWTKASINGDHLYWPTGDVDTLTIKSATSFEVTLPSGYFTAELWADGRLHWCDGDVWDRLQVLVEAPNVIQMPVEAPYGAPYETPTMDILLETGPEMRAKLQAMENENRQLRAELAQSKQFTAERRISVGNSDDLQEKLEWSEAERRIKDNKIRELTQTLNELYSQTSQVTASGQSPVISPDSNAELQAAAEALRAAERDKSTMAQQIASLQQELQNTRASMQTKGAAETCAEAAERQLEAERKRLGEAESRAAAAETRAAEAGKWKDRAIAAEKECAELKLISTTSPVIIENPSMPTATPIVVSTGVRPDPFQSGLVQKAPAPASLGPSTSAKLVASQTAPAKATSPASMSPLTSTVVAPSMPSSTGAAPPPVGSVTLKQDLGTRSPRSVPANSASSRMTPVSTRPGVKQYNSTGAAMSAPPSSLGPNARATSAPLVNPVGPAPSSVVITAGAAGRPVSPASLTNMVSGSVPPSATFASAQVTRMSNSSRAIPLVRPGTKM
jgi:hypothetical protein